MLRIRQAVIVGFSLAAGCALWGADGPILPSFSVGRCLQASGTIKLAEPAPAAGMEIAISSEDPGLLLLSTGMASPGTASIVLSVKPGMRETPEFFVHALGDDGTVNYTATGPAFGNYRGTVALSPSAIVLMGPFRSPTFRTTPRAYPSRLTVYAVRLDSSLKLAEQQLIAGGMRASVEVGSSEPEVAAIEASPLVIEGGASSAVTDLKPARLGNTTISVSVPPGFTKPLEHSSIAVAVNIPGVALTEELVVGQNLQVRGVLGLGEAAPEGGVTVSLSSSDPSRLLLSPSPTQVGTQTIAIKIPAGGVSADVYLQSLAKADTATYTATAPGYQTRTATVAFAPSGVVIMSKPYGPPDEAELVAEHSKGSPTGGVYTSLSKGKKMELAIWMVQLDPVTLRSADITVQPLRAGAPLAVDVQTSDPAIGKVVSPVKITPGTEFGSTEFTPTAVGSSVISVVTPAGFTKSTNSTSVTAIVQK